MVPILGRPGTVNRGLFGFLSSVFVHKLYLLCTFALLNLIKLPLIFLFGCNLRVDRVLSFFSSRQNWVSPHGADPLPPFLYV